MVIDLILAVLAVNISGTGPRPTTIRTPSESARRDEHSPRARALDITALTHNTADNITGADQYYNNGNCGRSGLFLGSGPYAQPGRDLSL